MDGRRLPHGHRHLWSSSPKVKVTFRILLFLACTVGFAYQCGLICTDYFKYPTVTRVSIMSALPVTTSPAVSIRILKPAKETQSIGDYFNSINDSTSVHHSYSRIGFTADEDFGTNKTLVNFRRFYRERFYYVHIRTREPTRFDPSDLYAFSQALYIVYVETQVVIMSKSKSRPIQLFMSSYHDDMEGILRTPLKVRCPPKTMCIFDLTYSVKVTKLAPPPYDTNCRDYTGSQFTSPDNCFSQCLTDFTSRYGMTLDSNVIWRDQYENSSLKVLPWYLKYMTIDDQVVTSDWIRDTEIVHFRNQNGKKPREPHLDLYIKPTDNHENNSSCNNCKQSEQSPPPPKEHVDFYQRLIDIFPSYKSQWTSCRKFCSQPSCYVETVIPQLIGITGTNTLGGACQDMAGKDKMSSIRMSVYPPIDQVVTVTSIPKGNLMDLIVYVLSSLSFWYGFCPLNIAMTETEKQDANGKRIKMSRLDGKQHQSRKLRNSIRSNRILSRLDS